MLPWLQAFLLTQLIECPIYVHAQAGSARRLGPKLGIAFVASAITHPVLWAVVQPGVGERMGDLLRFAGSDLAYNTTLVYWSAVAVAEAFAIVVEAIYLWSVGVRRYWMWSATANLASAAIGLTTRALFGFP